MFYTYAHYTPKGDLFYIGKGQGGRAYAFYQRGSHWNNVVNKYGKPHVHIVRHWETEQEALVHEIELIAQFRTIGINLVNKTDGGEGTSGYKHTDEQRENNRRARLGKPTWNKGIPCREETKSKVSIAKQGQEPWNKGVEVGAIHTEEFKQRISNLHKGNKYNLGRPTSEKQKAAARKTFKGNKHAQGNTTNRQWIWVGTDIKTGEVRKFTGEKEMKDAGIQHANVIKCLNGVRKSHKGCTWAREPWEGKL